MLVLTHVSSCSVVEDDDVRESDIESQVTSDIAVGEERGSGIHGLKGRGSGKERDKCCLVYLIPAVSLLSASILPSCECVRQKSKSLCDYDRLSS